MGEADVIIRSPSCSSRAGLRGVDVTALESRVYHATFEEWWGPFTLGVGPAGAYTSKLDADRRARVIERCRELVPPAPVEVTAWAWTARGLA